MKARWIAMLLLGLCLGCATEEGGIVGTGISTVSGNVSQVDDATAVVMPPPAAAVASIQVSIVEIPGLTTRTDTSGAFTLSGDFAGRVTVRFTPPNRMPFDLQLDVPAGSTVELDNVVLSGGVAVPATIKQRNVFGLIAEPPDCAADGTGVILVNDNLGSVKRLLVELTATTDIMRKSGVDLTCADLRAGQSVAIDGIVERSTRSLVATTIIVSGPIPVRTPMPAE